MSAAERKGVLLINVGTPDAPTAEAVHRYLAEFLMDPYVVDIPKPFRWLLVHGLILPKRSPASAALYQKIWSESGSPLLRHGRDLQGKLQAVLGDTFSVKLAMRYGAPSIRTAVAELRAEGVKRVTVLPLYPQFSLAATGSSVEAVRDEAGIGDRELELNILPPFYDTRAFLDSVAQIAEPILRKASFDLIVFSFHGLPERQIRKTDLSGKYCLASRACCARIGEINRFCYRAQCFETARLVAARLQLVEGQYQVAFQSRLGRTPWIQPFTDELYRSLPKRGIRRLAVLAPSFVADCLETLEEIAIRGKKAFVESGGEELVLIPCINSHETWVRGLARDLLMNQPPPIHYHPRT